MKIIKEMLDTAKGLWKDLMWAGRTEDERRVKQVIYEDMLKFQKNIMIQAQNKNNSMRKFYKCMTKDESLKDMKTHMMNAQKADNKIIKLIGDQLDYIKRVFK